MLIEVPRSDSDRPMVLAGNPVKLSETAEGPIRSFPGLGEHTDEVLGELLDLSDDELATLRADGIIGP